MCIQTQIVSSTNPYKPIEKVNVQLPTVVITQTFIEKALSIPRMMQNLLHRRPLRPESIVSQSIAARIRRIAIHRLMLAQRHVASSMRPPFQTEPVISEPPECCSLSKKKKESRCPEPTLLLELRGRHRPSRRPDCGRSRSNSIVLVRLQA